MTMEYQPSSEQCFVVVGAGQAGAVAVSTLRQSGFSGRVVLVGDEPHLPYERPPLSKEVLGTPATAKTTILDASFYAAHDIKCLVGVSATKLDPAQRILELSSGDRIAFDKLLLATGARARPYPLLDRLGSGVLSLRTLDDAHALRNSLKSGARLLVVGAGVIGLEVAASAQTLGVEVTVIERGTRVMARSAPTHLAEQLLAIHQAKGVQFAFGVDLLSAEKSVSGEITLHSSDNRVFTGDVVVYGVGVELNVGLAEQAGLKVDDGIVVDEFGMSSVTGIYAAGDVARQWDPRTSRYLRQETWSNAQNQSTGVARAMVTGESFASDLPWYWTDQYGHNIQVAGTVDADEWLTRGDPAGRYTQFGIRDGRIVGAITFDNGREMRPAKQLVSVAAKFNSELPLLDPTQDLRKLVEKHLRAVS